MQSIRWYMRRLSLMPPAEIVSRMGQSLVNRVERLLPYARPPRAQHGPQCLPAWPVPTIDRVEPYLQAADRVLGGEVDLFGQWTKVGNPEIEWNVDPERRVPVRMQHGKSIDYRDTNVVGSARNVWELNRHFQLVTLAQAWALSGDERYRNGARELLASWLRACPYPLGLNWTSPLEHGIRLINWYLAGRLLRLGEERSEFVAGWRDSILHHCQFIWSNQSRYTSANNHLIGEMAGLYVGACAWPYGSRSARWRADAKRILEREVTRQVHEDGVTREQSVGYQIFVLQLLLIVGLVGETFGDPFSSPYWSRLQRMIGFLRSVADIADHLPDFGDSDDGMAFMLVPDARSTRLQDLRDLELTFSQHRPRQAKANSTASWLLAGFPTPAAWPRNGEENRRAYPHGGYFVLGDRFGEPNEVSLVFDAAPLGYLAIAAHGHADCLSFTMSLAGEQILIDPGTYCYHSDPVWRDYFRSTAAHNTLRVDGCDQSEMGGPFMWLRKAQPTVESYQLEGTQQHIRARHDGYVRLPDPVLHTRELRFDAAESFVEVLDSLSCRELHDVERFWHFAEDCAVQQIDSRSVRIRSGKVELVLQCGDGGSIALARGSQSPRLGWVSPRFGMLKPTTTVVLRNSARSSTVLHASLRWRFA